MLAIKLQRIGKKGQPSYRLVVAPKRSKMKSPPVEDLGSYNPSTKQANLNGERAKYWMGVGAQPTVTAYNLLVKSGVVAGKARPVYMKKAAPAAAAPEAAAPAAPAESTAEVPAE